MGACPYSHRVAAWLVVRRAACILPVEGKDMPSVMTLSKETSAGCRARKLRLACRITRRELAAGAGVSTQEIGLFERNMPLPLDTRRRLLKELWARKSGK